MQLVVCHCALLSAGRDGFPGCSVGCEPSGPVDEPPGDAQTVEGLVQALPQAGQKQLKGVTRNCKEKRLLIKVEPQKNFSLFRRSIRSGEKKV